MTPYLNYWNCLMTCLVNSLNYLMTCWVSFLNYLMILSYSTTYCLMTTHCNCLKMMRIDLTHLMSL